MSRGVKLTALVIVVVVGIIGLMLVGVRAVLRSTIEVELQLAEPFLAIGAAPRLDEDYGTMFPDPLGSDLGSVRVIYDAEEPDVMVEQIQDVMRAEGWDLSHPDGTQWHSGGGDLGHRWGMISVDDDEVRLFIGVIEG